MLIFTSHTTCKTILIWTAKSHIVYFTTIYGTIMFNMCVASHAQCWFSLLIQHVKQSWSGLQSPICYDIALVLTQDSNFSRQWQDPTDWRTLRAEGWNKGGLGSRNKRMILRMQQQVYNQQRQLLGLASPDMTLQDQVRDDQIRLLTANLLENARFRAGVEQAVIAGQ